MKKIFTTATLTLGVLLLFAQSQISVPVPVKQNFKDAHPMHDFLTWEMEGANYKAKSTDPQGIHHINVYDAGGNLLRSEHEVADPEVPETINNYFTKNYPPNTKYTVWMTESAGTHGYFLEYNGQIIRFDSQGKVTNMRD